MKTNASTLRTCSVLLRIAAAIFSCALLGDVAPFHVAAGEALAEQKPHDAQPAAPAPAADTLQSEFLFELILERGTASTIGSPAPTRVIVPVAAGTVTGPRLKATVIAPSGDWIVVRPDGTSVLDLHLLLQTDDGQKIFMVSRGIAYTPAGGTFYARIVPSFETSAPNYTWLNNVVAVGVYRQEAGKIAYRVYRVL